MKRVLHPSWLLALVLPIGLALVARADDDVIEARMKRDIFFLASDECEGRGVGTKGIDQAADFIAQQFARSGLRPGGPSGSWFQPFTMTGKVEQEGVSKVTLRGPLGQTVELKTGKDFEVMGISGSGKATAPVVFVGYGATAKEIGYDDYQGIDVAGKIVIALRHVPRWTSKEVPFDGQRRDEHASLERKGGLAEINGAAALIVLNDSTEDPAGDKLMPFGFLQGASGLKIPAVQVRRAIFDSAFQGSLNTRLIDIERAIDRDLKPRSANLIGWTATIEAGVKRTVIAVKNVVGVLEGHGPLAKETIVIGAHYDHLGYGGRGSRAKEPNKRQIHYGADDNGSGTTAVMELSRRFGVLKDREGRRLVFVAWSAEESGLLGSKYYCNKEPLFALADTAAYVNLDMVGRLRNDKDSGKPRLLVEGSGTAKTFDKLLADLNPGFHYVKKPGGNGPSDHDSFYRQKIPVIFFWTDTHEDYHRPTDTADKIDIAGMNKVTGFAEKVIHRLAEDEKRPEYVLVASTFTPGGGGKGPKLGIMPNYDENKEGVLVGGLADDGPAAKGGLKSGDLIVEIAGKQVKNLNNYMVIMAAQKANQPIEVGVMRDGKKLSLKVTPK